MCVFCEIAKGNIPCYKVYEDDFVISFLDLNPATKGHTLVVPKKHIDNIFSLSTTDAMTISKAVVHVSNLLKEKLNVQNLNVVNNNGALAGQSVMHLHVHIIPRYENDQVIINKTQTSPTKVELETILKEIKG